MAQQAFSFTMPVIEIQFSPLEEDDLETVTALGLVEDALRREATALEYYELVSALPQASISESKTRGGGDVFHLISTFVQTIHDQQDFIKIMIGAGITALTLLLKQRRVKKIEVKLGKKTLLIEHADQRAAQTYLQQFEALCKEEEMQITPASKLEIKAHVSKKSTSSKEE